VKDSKTIFIQSLLRIFNASLRQSKFPSLWKISKIIPVFKNGDRSIIDNYRPISILSNFSKIFEIVLYSYIYPYITNFISPQQHGFLKNVLQLQTLPASHNTYPNQLIKVHRLILFILTLPRRLIALIIA
jgi:hypothetical protein